MRNEITTLYENKKVRAVIRTEYLKNAVWWVCFSYKVDDKYLHTKGKRVPKDDLEQIIKIADNYNDMEIRDRRDEGWYCCHCKTFNLIPQMVFQDLEITQINGKSCIVKTHYDGCKGWN
jgi:hypothetical protein